MPRLRPLFARLWWLVVGATWLYFWVVDLHNARFQVLLAAAVPVALLCVVALRRSLLHDAALGVIATLAGIWPLLYKRSMNGCTGVSDAYELTLVVTAVAVYALGPLIVSHHIVAGSYFTESERPRRP